MLFSHTLLLTVISSLLYSLLLGFHAFKITLESDCPPSESEVTMLNALWIVIMGMIIVFAVLGILLLVMLALGKIFKTRENHQEG